MSSRELAYVVPARELASAYAALRLLGLRAVFADADADAGWVRLALSSPGDPRPLSRGEAALLAMYGTLAEGGEAR